MKKLPLMLVMIIAVCMSFATIDEYYTFNETAGTYTPITGTDAGISQDDALSDAISIGFSFPYGDNNYTEVKVSSNSWVDLGATQTGSNLSNNLDSTTLCPVLAPLWDDTSMSDGDVQYVMEGTAPDRIFTIQYTNAKWRYSGTTYFDYQVKLHESGNIEFVYGPSTGDPYSPNASIGINMLPGDTGWFYSITPGDPATASTQTEDSSVAVFPGEGTIYEFTTVTPADNDLEAISIDGNTTPSVDTETTYTISVKNRGANPQTTYSVKLYVDDVEVGSVAGTSIQPNETLTYDMDWTPTAEGPATLYGKVVLAGDENPDNDQTPDLDVEVQPADVYQVTIGDGSEMERRPFDFYWKNSLHETIYLQSEIGIAGLITGITFYNNFVTDLPDKPVKIFMGTTTETDLSGGWITANDMTLVFDGTVSFPSGENTIMIPLQTPFDYLQDNLVVMAKRVMDTDYFSSSDDFKCQTVGTGRSRKLQSDTTDYDPYNPQAAGTLSGQFPMTTLSFVVGGLAALEGTVTSDTNPVADVDIVINTTTHATTTGADGTYSFPYVEPGNYTVTASKLGYESQTLPVTLVADETATLDFDLTTSSSVTVTGHVVGSDQPTVGLADAIVAFSGVMDYDTTTDANGDFTIPGVLSGNTYDYVISLEGYQNLTGSVDIGATDYDMGTLTLNEIAFPPSQVVATENIDQTEVDIIWQTPVPAPPYDDFEMNDGGWIPTADWDPVGDWEWTDSYDFNDWTNTGSTGTNVNPPPNAYSGTGMWGTVINTNYTNAGGFSFLTKEISLAGVSNAEMRFWSWENVFGNFDYCQVAINGTVVWGPSWEYSGTTWTERVIDLSAYDGQSNVEVQFQMWATTVVNYAGWYIDDVYIGPAQTRAITSAPSVMPDYLLGLTELEAAASAEEYAQTHPVSRPPQTPNTRIIEGYKVWRLLSADEGDENLWTLLTPATIADTTYTDTAWEPLPSGVYKFAVKSVYSNDVLSEAAFSNEIHKGMMGTLEGTVTEFGTNVPVEGATITAGDYSGTSDADGDYAFLVYQGTYDVTCARPGYQSATQTNVEIVGTQTTTVDFVLTEITLPPGGVQAEEADPSTVNVTWMEPGTGGGEWLHYDSGQNNDSIGTGAAADFDVAIRFPASEMQDYAGMSLYAVKAWPAQAGTFSIRVWTGGDASAPDQMVVDQPFTPAPLDSYNTVLLDDPVSITGTEELWFGYRCNVTSGYPAGCDAGPADDGFGNMMYYQGAWAPLTDLNPDLDYNWNIQGYVGYSAPTAAPLLTQGIAPAMPEGERLCIGSLSTSGNPRKGHTRSAQPEGEAKQVDSAGMISWQSDRTLEGYKVWRLLQGQEGNETAWISLTPDPITATAYQDTGWGDLTDGTYKWAVKAIYTGGAQSIAAFSNPLTLVTQIGTIAGIVRTMENAPIMGATVTCGDATATTNASGAYSMQVEAGTWSVTASHPDYQSVTQDGVIVVVGQTTTVNFQLPESMNLLEDGFESYDNFALEFAPWTLVDVDLSGTYGMTGVTWPNAYEAMAYMIFVPSATTPPVDDADPHGGIKEAASFASTTPPNDDWLITPVLTNPDQLSFWAKSYTDQYGLERFKVGVSTTGTDPADFTIISGANYIEAPTDWTEYTYDISSYDGDVYAGIQCVSNDAFIFFVDDVLVTGGTPNDDPNAPVVATELRGNYPNPFNPETTIRYSVKEAMPVTLNIYNVKGQLVKTLVKDVREAGNYSVVWNGRDNNNQTVSSGVYYFKMNAGKYSNTKKMILMK
ncbi:MAG: carboxypeptidase regulatory-like domain-containing protein [Candidatus Syntrophosphaera sp.]